MPGLVNFSNGQDVVPMNIRSADAIETPKDAAPAGMAWVPGSTYMMGSDHHYPEEAPAHPVRVDGFWIDEAPVTNGQFLTFVNATGHVSFAEKKPLASDYPG